MESIRHDRDAGKGLLHRQLHIRGHIQSHLGDGVPRSVRESREHLGNLAGFRALDHRDEGSLLPVFGLVRERGPELAIRHGHLVEAQLGADILWKEHPFLGVLVLIPVLEAAQVVFVLLFELLGLQLVRPRNGGECDRLSLRFLLLKKQRTPSPAGCRGNRAGGRVSDTRPVLSASNSVVGRSGACVSPAGENR